MKTCTHCNVSKQLEFFHKDKSRADGLRNRCKECVVAYMAGYYKANTDQVKARVSEWVANNRDRHNAKCAKWVRANPGKVNARTARRYACKTQATPSWLTEDDHWMLAEAYDLARLRTKVVGIKFEVDHIVPLRGRKVRGMHVPWNLQVVPHKTNRTKSNKFEVAS